MSRSAVRSLFVSALAAALVISGLPPGTARPAAAVSPNIVISQVYGGGGNAGATYTNDFIELFNRGAASVTMTNWSVQYASSTGTSWAFTTINGTIPAGGYFLIQEAQGMGGTTPLPPPVDATGIIAMSATAGKVALRNTNTAITSGTSCPTADVTVIDLVGYGTTANCFEGAGPAPAPSNTTADLRGGNGCTDTDNNVSDFSTAAPAPRNSATTPAPCGGGDAAPTVQSTTPADNATGVAVDSNITITFSEPVNVAAGWFSISCTNSGAHTAAQSGGPTTFTLNPDSNLSGSETCTVTIEADNVSDQDTDDPPDDMAADYTFDFQTATPAVAIHDVQGASHQSPVKDTSVTLQPAIVTVTRGNGFYLQATDAQADADVATSEAILVFTSTAPTVSVGDQVTVSGTVTEFRPGGASPTNANLTTTEITSPTVTVASSGNPLPAATIIGTGGRTPPTEVIEDDATGSVETSGVFDPATDGIDFYESLEAMRVQINDAVAVGPTNDFGEIAVLSDNGASASVRTTRGGIVIRETDFNPERVILDDAVIGGGQMPNVNVGDGLGTVVGLLDYGFGNFKLLVTTAPTRDDNGLAREVTGLTRAADELTMASFNVENLDPGDGAAKFSALADLIVDNLLAPDIITLEEIQDDNGPTNDTTTDASVTAATLITAIQTAGGPTYDYRDIDPVDDKDGGEPGGNIRVGFLFRTDRGVAFVDRPGGTSTSDTTVVSGTSGPELSASPGRVDPTDPAFTSSRKPLAGEFTFNGKTIFVIANHFNSKGGDEPLFGRYQPPTLHSEAQREEQAKIVNDFVEAILAVDPNAYVAVMGDLNDFPWSDPVQEVAGDDLTILIDTLPVAERYTYVFDGNSQVLDHILVSSALNAAHNGFDVAHVNAEFHDQVSDHDPAIVRVGIAAPVNEPPTAVAMADPTTTEAFLDVDLDGRASTDDDGTIEDYAWDFDGDGVDDVNGQDKAMVSHAYRKPGTYEARLTVTDDDGDSDSDTVTITVIKPQYDFQWVAPTVEPPGRNRFVAGDQEEVYFSLGDDYGLDIFRQGWPTQQRYVCGTRYDFYANARGSTLPFGSEGLSHDTSSGVYTYSWDTYEGWDGQCRQFRIRLRLEPLPFPFHFVDVKFRAPQGLPT